VALQLTVVLPSPNDAPDCGEQPTTTGGMPPESVGAGYGTVLPLPVTGSVMLDGHDSAGGPNVVGGGFVGCTGFLAQLEAPAAAASHRHERAFRVRVRAFDVITAVGRERPGGLEMADPSVYSDLEFRPFAADQEPFSGRRRKITISGLALSRFVRSSSRRSVKRFCHRSADQPSGDLYR
jgi:hypothetical protein